MPQTVMLVAAAGSSTRMGCPKQSIPLCGEPVLLRTLRALEAADRVQAIVLVTREADVEEFRRLAQAAGIGKLYAVVPGGADRQQSVERGLAALPPDTGWIGIHDGARPLVSPALVNAVIEAAQKTGAAAAAVPVWDTLKRTDDDGRVTATVERKNTWRVQTPQVFDYRRYKQAMVAAQAAGQAYTDDCQLMEAAGVPVQLIRGEETNLKLTVPEDVVLATAILRQREGESTSMRIGHGYDVHRLVEGRPLILGGVPIPYTQGLLGHSDADVLTHAIMDALLGAAALGDIGGLFPDTDPAYAGADSVKLLEQVIVRLRETGYVPVNVDATVLAQQPKLKPHIGAMRQKLAEVCGLPPTAVSVKATTEEGLGFTGAMEGIAAHAVCLIRPV